MEKYFNRFIAFEFNDVFNITKIFRLCNNISYFVEINF